MLKKYKDIFVLCSLILLFSCNKEPASTAFRFHDNGSSKPIVLLSKILESSPKSTYKWSVSEELSQEVLRFTQDHNQLYLSQPILSEFKKEDFFLSPKELNKSLGMNHDYLVMMSLIQHEIIPYARSTMNIKPIFKIKGYPVQALIMKVRIKVFKLSKKNEPQLILHEIVRSNHEISHIDARTNYDQISWNDFEYTDTALSKAHKKLAFQLTDHYEDYIRINRVEGY